VDCSFSFACTPPENAAPPSNADLNRIPIKAVVGATICMKDVAWVRDGFPLQTNIVRVNGQRSVLVTIQKRSGFRFQFG
jgi:multidrug efflux pump subunit AcrB